VTAELARAGGVVGAAGLAAVLVAPRRDGRLAGLAALAVGSALLAIHLAPSGHTKLLAAAAVAGVIAVVVGAFLFHRWPWLLPLAALACVPARVPVSVGATDSNLLIPLYGVVAAAAIVFAYELIRGERGTRELGPLSWPLALFVGWSGLTLAWTNDLHEGSIELLFFYLPFGLLAVLLARLAWTRRLFEALVAELAAMALAFSAIGVWQWATRDVFWNPKIIVGNAYAPFYRVNSVFWDPSIYGRFLVVAILTLLVLALLGASKRVVTGSALAIAGIWVGLVFSFSQSSFFALLTGTALVAFFVWRWRAAALLAAGIVAVMIVALVLPGARHRSLNAASGGRFKLVTNGLAIAAHHPVQGVGIGGFKRAYANRTHLKGKEPKAAASHNTPVTVLAETGAPGLLLAAWLFATALAVALPRAGRGFTGRAPLVCGVALFAIAVHSLFYNAFFEDPMVWAMLALIPLTSALPRRREETPKPAPLGRQVEAEREEHDRVDEGQQDGAGQRDVEFAPEHDQTGGRADEEPHAAPLVGHGVHALGVEGHQEEHEGEGDRVGDRRADHPVARDELEVEGDRDEGRDAGYDPVELSTPRTTDPDHDDVEGAPGDRLEAEQADDARARVELAPGGQQPDEPRR
jgi:O-antigen ligase